MNNTSQDQSQQASNNNEPDYKQKLFSQNQQNYGNKYREHYLDIYKMYISTSEKISDRRQTNNSFFLTLNTAIIAVISYLQLGEKVGTDTKLYWLVSLSGIILCYSWYRLIRSYKDLNTGKFKIIILMEEKLPLAPYEAEWDALGRGEEPKLFLQFTKTELIIPWVFMGIHIAVLIQVFPWKSIFNLFKSLPL